MSTPLDLAPILDFLFELRQNNHKSWFEANRSRYEAARGTFETFVSGIIEEYREIDGLRGLKAKDCIARIHRDVRFSKDKSPYKTNLGALVGPNGWKSTWRGYYISLEPGGRSMTAGGLYAPDAEQLERFRRSIDRDPRAFKEATGGEAFVQIFGAVQGERLKTAPRGYDKDHPEIGLLQLKQITVIRHFTDDEVLSPAFSGQVIAACRAMRPFIEYLADILE